MQKQLTAIDLFVCGGMGRERNLIIDDRLTDFTPVTHIKGEVNHQGIHRLTPRECARLQGFPDLYEFNLADTSIFLILMALPPFCSIAPQYFPRYPSSLRADKFIII